MSDFIPGLDLAEGFYRDAVCPLVERVIGGRPHAAALLGPGSEVLGFDDATSTDHDWGPRLQLFLDPADWKGHGRVLGVLLSNELPPGYRGFRTSFDEPPPPGAGVLTPAEPGPIRHRIDVTTVPHYARVWIGRERPADLHPYDWLVLPSQILRSLVAGRVFRDDLGLEAFREGLRWYPDDVWRYLLAAAWQRIGQEEHLVWRAAQAGDTLGARLICARLVRDVMRLGFLVERVYAPYAKWFGAAFRALDVSTTVTPLLEAALETSDADVRGDALGRAYVELGERTNALVIAKPVVARTSPFHTRPFTVIHGERFSAALVEAVGGEAMRALARRRLIGSLDQFSDSTDLAAPEWRARLRALYETDAPD